MIKQLVFAASLVFSTLFSNSVESTSRTQYTLASYYDTGSITANGEDFNPDGFTAAHRRLPFGTYVLVTNLTNNQSVVVRINDRGPYIRPRGIDLARAAAEHVDMIERGVVRVRIRVLTNQF